MVTTDHYPCAISAGGIRSGGHGEYTQVGGGRNGTGRSIQIHLIRIGTSRRRRGDVELAISQSGQLTVYGCRDSTGWPSTRRVEPPACAKAPLPLSRSTGRGGEGRRGKLWLSFGWLPSRSARVATAGGELWLCIGWLSSRSNAPQGEWIFGSG